jgi:multidrug resistance protein MdtO
MPPPDVVVSRGSPFVEFLRTELAPRPGRFAAVARITVCSTLMVVIWMIFQIPLPMYPAYIVFLLSRGEPSGTLMVAAGGAIAATFAVAFSLLLYTLDAGEPALRIPLMALSTFVGMYLMRAISVGQIAFLAGFVLVITQTLIDDAPNTEALTRLVLWLWVVVVAPAVLTALVDLVASQPPAALVRNSMAQLFGIATSRLRNATLPPIGASQSAAPEFAELRHRITMLDRRLAARAATDVEVIATIDELTRVATLLPADVPDAVRASLAARCDAYRAAAVAGTAPPDVETIPRALVEALDADSLPVVVAVENVLDRVADALRRSAPVDKPAPPRRASLFVADAFTNPEHVRFALKATLATMAVYIIYRGLDWPGIRTCVITCFFVALGTAGETMHKLTLRIAGALIGGLLGGLCIVYVLPHMTDIGDLCVLIALVTALCAWVATSSELLAYAGMQMALAFYIGVLQGYGPGTELAELRDRVAGILLGNVAMSIVFSTVWPVSARTSARRALAGAVRGLAELLRAQRDRASAASLLAISRLLNQARQLMAVSTFEAPLLPQPRRLTPVEPALDAVERIAAAVFVLNNQAPSRGTELTPTNEPAAVWLTSYAAHLGGGAPVPAPLSSVGGSTTNVPSSIPSPADRAVRDAQALLMTTMDKASRYAT